MSIREEIQTEMNTLHDEIATVSKAFHEIEKVKTDYRIRKRNIIIIILCVLLLVSNLAWLVYSTRFEKVVETTTETYTLEGIEQTAEGSNYIVGGDIIGETEN